MTKIEAIDKAIILMKYWKDEHDYCLHFSRNYPEVRKEFDEIVQAEMILEKLKELFLDLETR